MEDKKMKQRFKNLGILLLGAVLSTPVIADEDSNDSERLTRAERFELADTDGDGRLNRDERQAVRETRRENLLERFDDNADGRLDRVERQDIRHRRANVARTE